MYTRIAKGILVILNVLGVIAALVIAGFVGTQSRDGGVGFIAFIVALIVIELVLLFFGMFVEVANNILDIKNCLKEWDSLQKGKGNNLDTEIANNILDIKNCLKEWDSLRKGKETNVDTSSFSENKPSQEKVTVEAVEDSPVQVTEVSQATQTEEENGRINWDTFKY